MRPPAGRYIVPFTTIGVASENPAIPVSLLPASLGDLNRYDQACFRFATFLVVIWVSGEYRVPARSRLYMGQSPPAGALDCCADSSAPMARGMIHVTRIAFEFITGV